MNELEQSLAALREAIDDAIKQFGIIDLRAYHRMGLGDRIADCYDNGAVQRQVELCFKDIPVAWEE